MNAAGLAFESLERLLDGLDDVLVCGLDREGRILHSNRSCEKVTGYDRGRLHGQRWVEIFARAERADRIRDLWSQAAAGAATPPFEALCRNQRRIRWRFAHWMLDEPHLEGLCAYGFDVTRDRELLARARAAERTVAVAQLSAGLAHEIRNPLNSAKLQLDLAARRIGAAQGERAAEAVRLASQEVLRANALLTDFLAFARPPRVELGPVDLRGLVLDVKGRLTEAHGAGVDVEVEVEPGPGPIVDADDELVSMALEQLVRNAIDAAAARGAEGRVIIRIRVEMNAACVEIEDNGPGLPSPDAPVFEAFFTTKPGSTGLGLAIVQRVAFDHGGSVSCSRRNDRTVFALRLPTVFGSEIS
jgi:signal transduction histidine kinase